MPAIVVPARGMASGIVHTSALVSQYLPHDRHGAKELGVMRIERPRRQVAAPIGTRHVFGAALSRLRLSRRTDSDNGCATVLGLPDISIIARMTLSGAVAGPVLIAGRVLPNSRRAGKIALLPRLHALGPRRGRRRVESCDPEQRQRDQASGADASTGEKGLNAHESAPISDRSGLARPRRAGSPDRRLTKRRFFG